MPFTPNQNLTENTDVVLRSYQHGDRLFVDNQFQFAPKLDFLYHVAFGLNSAALKTLTLKQSFNAQLNMLVKKTSLPSFTMEMSQGVNQYNRKKNIQTAIKYNNIRMEFHDDNLGIVNELWQNYFSYYYADPTIASKPGAYARNATQNFNSIPGSYGLDNGSTAPFFTYIKLYQMARHEYVMYQLWNPILVSWNHNEVAYSSSEAHANSLEIAYEAVSYSTGPVVDGQTPEGFALTNYDLTPSPLQGTGGATNSQTLTGNSTLVAQAPNFLNQQVQAVNTYQNTKQPGATAPNILTSIPTTLQNVNNLANTVFPAVQAATSAVSTIGSLINLL